MFKKVAIFIGILSVLAFSGCSRQSEDTSGKVKVSVSFNAMQELVSVVGGDKVSITTIVPDGTEPHDFEPKGRDMETLSKADIFVYNGLGMESWAKDAVKAAGNKKLIAVEASKGAELIKLTDPEEIREHGDYDPHTWLSLKNAITAAQNIRDALDKADPENKTYYDKNCEDFIAKVDSVYTEYSTKFAALPSKNIVTGHAAFGYMCRDFGLTQNSIEDVYASGEPTAQQLAKLVDYCKANGVKTVFVEEMASPQTSKTLANQVGAKTVQIYTIESSEDNKSYLDRMIFDLNAFYDSLANK